MVLSTGVITPVLFPYGDNMILFEMDWGKYPSAIADVKSVNKTWVRTAAVYQSMGITNCYFLLALTQPSLQGVDPHSPDLTIEQKTAIIVECKINPWYFFREVLRLPFGNTPLQFRCNRGVVSLLWSFFCNIDFSLIMPRQIGKSVTVDGLDVWLLIFGLVSSEIFLFTKDRELRKRNIARIKETIAILPKWMNPTNKYDLDNTEVVTMAARGNLLKSAVGQSQKDRANNIGRGETLIVTKVDEGPFIPNIHISLPVLLAAGGAARDNAEAAGIPYGNIFTTTAGKKDTKEGKFMYNLIHSGMYWNEKLLFDLDNKYEARAVVATNSKNKRTIINGTFSHRQVGYSDEWLLRKIAASGGTADEIDRDYYNRWTSGTESSPITTQLAGVIKLSEMSPLYTKLYSNRYLMRWYIDESKIAEVMQTGHFVIGLDSSNAVGKDANGLVITDIRDMSVIATSSISEANLFMYAKWLAEFMIRYENTTLVIENKSSGQSIIDTISAMFISVGIDPFTRIFNYIADDHILKAYEYAEISNPKDPEATFLRYKGQLGFMTTGNRRAFLYSTVLQDAVKSTGHLVRDAGLSSEITSLVQKGDRVDHLEGGTDDSVIAWVLCHYFVKHAKNLQHYGIDTRMCLSLVSNDGATISEDDLVKRKLLVVVNADIEELKEQLIGAPTVIQTLRIERVLTGMVAKAQNLGDTTLTMNSIMEEVSECKVSKRSLSQAVGRFNVMRKAA